MVYFVTETLISVYSRLVKHLWISIVIDFSVLVTSEVSLSTILFNGLFLNNYVLSEFWNDVIIIVFMIKF